jgi:hypothetical protein
MSQVVEQIVIQSTAAGWSIQGRPAILVTSIRRQSEDVLVLSLADDSELPARHVIIASGESASTSAAFGDGCILHPALQKELEPLYSSSGAHRKWISFAARDRRLWIVGPLVSSALDELNPPALRRLHNETEKLDPAAMPASATFQKFTVFQRRVFALRASAA